MEQPFRDSNVGVPLVDHCVVAIYLTATQGDDAKSARLFKELLSLFPGAPAAIKALVQLSSKRGGEEGYTEAREWTDKLVELRSEDPASYYARMKVLLAFRDTQGALVDANRALELSNNSAEALAERATVYVRMKEHSNAYVDLMEIVQRGEATPHVYFLLGQTEVTFAHIQKAIDACKLSI